MNKTSTRELSFLVKGIVCLLAIFILNYLVTPIFVGENKLEEFFRPRGKLDFDPLMWKSAAMDSGKRYEMVDSLLDSRQLLGLSDLRVKQILGEPSALNFTEQGDKVMTYYLSRQRNYPASSFLFPYFFPNHEIWMLSLLLTNRNVESAKVIFN